jgi:hypothetical protein
MSTSWRRSLAQKDAGRWAALSRSLVWLLERRGYLGTNSEFSRRGGCALSSANWYTQRILFSVESLYHRITSIENRYLRKPSMLPKPSLVRFQSGPARYWSRASESESFGLSHDAPALFEILPSSFLQPLDNGVRVTPRWIQGATSPAY